ncbi:MAG: hypothetical protein NT062_32005, partial [Proteobacteria bacterium]|nr:hypothetical protein [Pseudomonadota bacterium]
AVGMGAPQVAAGAFSVDLVAYLCLATPRGAHAVLLHDRFKLLRPGETEVRVEDAPGITIARARIGDLEDPAHDYRFAGTSPLADDGLDLGFVTSDRAPLTGACQASAAHGISSGGLGLLLGVGALGLGVLLVVGVRRSRARARQP